MWSMSEFFSSSWTEYGWKFVLLHHIQRACSKYSINRKEMKKDIIIGIIVGLIMGGLTC